MIIMVVSAAAAAAAAAAATATVAAVLVNIQSDGRNEFAVFIYALVMLNVKHRSSWAFCCRINEFHS